MQISEGNGPPQPEALTDSDWNEWAAYVAVNFGLILGAETVAVFKALLAELKDWNTKINLVSFKNDKEVLYRHFADSLAGAKLIARLGGGRPLRIADVGTGAGFPGIPVYSATGDKDITLIESITKKTLFLAHLKEKLQLTGIKIINDRAENIARDKTHREGYDFVLSRALSKLSPNLEVVLPLLKTGGYAIIYKTERSASDEELSLAANALRALGSEISDKFCYTIPYEEQGYCALAFKKTSKMSDVYPRRAGVPEKKPL